MKSLSPDSWELLQHLLAADFALPQETAIFLNQVAGEVERAYPDLFRALFIGGSTTDGGAVAKSFIEQTSQRTGISDIDYGVILSADLSEEQRKLLHTFISARLLEKGLRPCPNFNAKNIVLPLNYPENLAQWLRQLKTETEPIRYAAVRLLLPFGVIFPLSRARQLQDEVLEGLAILSQLDPEYAQAIESDMSFLANKRRILKQKHIPDDQIRELLNQGRAAASGISTALFR